MKQPIIFVIDDDAQVLRSIERDIISRYRKSYRILRAESGGEALEIVKELKLRNEPVALFLSDQRMPLMTGVEFLTAAREYFPDSKRVLLTAYTDTTAAIQAINDVQLDYYLVKPWDPPQEKLYPVLDDLLDNWENNFKPGYGGIKVLGFQWSPKSHSVKDFLAANLFPYSFYDIERNEKAKLLLSEHQIDLVNLPALIFEDGTVLTNPTLVEVAEKVGLRSHASQKVYDVVIIGAGPAGLAASVYGGSEGLKTLMIEKRAPGGQAGASAKIENYLGFPAGLSGADLTRRAITQVAKFGVEVLTPAEVKSIKIKDNYKIITLEDGSELNAMSIVITTGVSYTHLEAKNIESFTGAGVYYGAANTEVYACENKEVHIVGGGNSAGQAAVYLSKVAKRVFLITRRDSLAATMSQYLIDQIEKIENITVLNSTVIEEAIGNGHLEALVIKNMERDTVETVSTNSVFIFIGTKPYSDWIPTDIVRNDKGFIETGRDLLKYPDFKKDWLLEREPFLLECSIPGIFVAGDVRSGAMGRIASAVGEGAMAIKFVHEYLSEFK